MGRIDRWLERLESATAYRELHALFEEISAEAQATEDPTRLIEAIDGAVVRVDRERRRDEGELRGTQREYESFRATQRGMLGWLRRHLPFTRTRREDKQRRTAIEDHQAEVLADSLMIARAKMLKETLLPGPQRSLGSGVGTWEEVLSARAKSSLLEHAGAVRDLGVEVKRGREFVAGIEVDVKGFEEAEFSDPEDRERKALDLEAARRALAACALTLEEKRALGERARADLHARVGADLERQDAEHGRRSERIPRLAGAAQGAARIEETLRRLGALIVGIREGSEKLADIPRTLGELDQKETRIREDLEAAGREGAAAARAMAEHEVRVRNAERDLQQARAAVREARTRHEAFVRESGQVELPAGGDFASSSPAAAELERAERAHEQAESLLGVARAPLQAAKAQVAQAEAEQRSLEEALSALERDRERRATEQEHHREMLEDAYAELQAELDRAPAVVEPYVAAASSVERSPQLTDLRDQLLPRRRFEVPGVDVAAHDLERAMRRCDELLASIVEERKEFEDMLARDRAEHEAAVARHLRTLLGPELVEEIYEAS